MARTFTVGKHKVAYIKQVPPNVGAQEVVNEWAVWMRHDDGMMRPYQSTVVPGWRGLWWAWMRARGLERTHPEGTKYKRPEWMKCDGRGLER